MPPASQIPAAPRFSVVVNGRGARRARRGHPWIYRDDVTDVSPGVPPGEVVAVLERSGRFCCWATWSPASRIPLRRVTCRPEPPDDAFWSAALDRALARRGALAAADGPTCVRLLHADGDGFPGLTIDRYGPHLVLQATTAWADRQGPALAGAVADRTGAQTILCRNDGSVRALEGLAREVAPCRGRTPETIEVVEAGIRRLVDPWHGHKTGLYLDQQENHRKAPEWLRPREAALGAWRVLDVFAAEGGFALPLAAAGARVLAVEQSEGLVARAQDAAQRTGLAEDSVAWETANAFDVLARLERAGASFDAIVLDPPPFARRREETGGAQRGYRDLHRRALRLLARGGRLLSFSCSFAIDDAAFEASVREAADEAADGGALDLAVLARPGAGPDHPETLLLPESRYLKGLLLERVTA